MVQRECALTPLPARFNTILEWQEDGVLNVLVITHAVRALGLAAGGGGFVPPTFPLVLIRDRRRRRPQRIPVQIAVLRPRAAVAGLPIRTVLVPDQERLQS